MQPNAVHEVLCLVCGVHSTCPRRQVAVLIALHHAFHLTGSLVQRITKPGLSQAVWESWLMRGAAHKFRLAI